jgi:PAS domain S-box-containing protein
MQQIEEYIEMLERSSLTVLSEAIINSNSNPIYAVDADLRFIAFNNAFRDFYKRHFDLNAEIGDRINSYGKDDTLSKVLNEKYYKALKGESATCDTIDGDMCYEKRFNPICLAPGSMVIGVSVLMYDVSEKRSLEREIVRGRNRYEEIIDSVNDIIFQADNNGDWTFLNKSWEEKLGHKLTESIGKPFFSFVHPEDVQTNLNLFIPLINRKKEYCSHQTRYMTNTGAVRWMKVYAVLILDENNEIQGTSGTLTDITAEVENLEKYRLLADNINDSVCLHDLNGNFSYVSPSIEQLSGYKPEELIGKNPYLFIHPEDMDKVAQVHEKLLNGDNTYLTTYRFLSKNGVYHWYETNNKLIRDSRGDIINLITSSRIVDERMRAEENTMQALGERRKLNDQKSKFITMASHEFRTPITSIQMSTDIIDLHLRNIEAPAGQEIKRHIDIINKEVERFQVIMNDILTLGKTENDSFSLKRSEIDITNLIGQCVSRVSELASDERVVEISVHGQERSVFVDESQMEHIIENLLTNAYKFSKGKRAPELKVIFHKDRFVIHLQDYGIGIPESDQSRLFSSFYRASNTANIRGTGLGLVIIKNLVRLHKGVCRQTNLDTC